MAQIVVRNLALAVKSALRQRAARRGVSMEAEAREILQEASSESISNGMVRAIGRARNSLS